jgi:hypothetical protein
MRGSAIGRERARRESGYEQGRVSLEPGPEDHLLHELAAEGLRQWFGVDGAELGLGSFDPPAGYGFVELS